MELFLKSSSKKCLNYPSLMYSHSNSPASAEVLKVSLIQGEIVQRLTRDQFSVSVSGAKMMDMVEHLRLQTCELAAFDISQQAFVHAETKKKKVHLQIAHLGSHQ